MHTVLYVLAAATVVVTGTVLIIGLAAIMITGECSDIEYERDPESWGVE